MNENKKPKDKNKLLTLTVYLSDYKFNELSRWCRDNDVLIERSTEKRSHFAYELIFKAKKVYKVAKAIEAVDGGSSLKIY